MVLQAITEDTLHWHCQGQDEEEEECGARLSASLDEVEYRLPTAPGKRPGRGAVIALPRCSECRARTTLKADYTLSELSKIVCPVRNEQGVIWAYVIPLRYVRNLRLHWMLYERGKAEHAPVLPMPAQELLARPEVAAISDVDVAYALWFGYLTMKYRKEKLGVSSNYNDHLLPFPVRDTGAAVAGLPQSSQTE